jgi:hypothetical protein
MPRVGARQSAPTVFRCADGAVVLDRCDGDRGCVSAPTRDATCHHAPTLPLSSPQEADVEAGVVVRHDVMRHFGSDRALDAGAENE